MSYTNADGLYIRTRVDEGEPLLQGTTAGCARKTLVMDLDWTTIGSSFGSSNINPMNPIIPAKSIIVNADLVILTAFTGSSSTLTIGTYNSAGTAVDADGIDATIALTAIDADNDVVQCDGAQVSGIVNVGNADCYVGAIWGTAAFTAGVAKLVIEYIELT